MCPSPPPTAWPPETDQRTATLASSEGALSVVVASRSRAPVGSLCRCSRSAIVRFATEAACLANFSRLSRRMVGVMGLGRQRLWRRSWQSHRCAQWRTSAAKRRRAAGSRKPGLGSTRAASSCSFFPGNARNAARPSFVPRQSRTVSIGVCRPTGAGRPCRRRTRGEARARLWRRTAPGPPGRTSRSSLRSSVERCRSGQLPP